MLREWYEEIVFFVFFLCKNLKFLSKIFARYQFGKNQRCVTIRVKNEAILGVFWVNGKSIVKIFLDFFIKNFEFMVRLDVAPTGFLKSVAKIAAKFCQNQHTL